MQVLPAHWLDGNLFRKRRKGARPKVGNRNATSLVSLVERLSNEIVLLMTKKALLIGVNEYGYHNADLRGCVNDVRSLADLLAGYEYSAIEMLTDDSATAADIRMAIDELLSDMVCGDQLVISFSGHGAQVPDRSRDEADGLDEVICPYGINFDDSDSWISDDWLSKRLNSIPLGVDCLVLMDCCHSGGNSRSAPGSIITPRVLENPKIGYREPVGRRVVDVHHTNGNAVVYSACRENQLAREVFTDGKFNGAFTAAIVKTIKEGATDHLGVRARVHEILEDAGFDQAPQLEGANLDRIFAL